MASTKIDIIANNKASAALGKVNRDVKKIGTSSQGLNDNFRKMKGLVLGVGAALGGIKLAKSFLDTATQLEGLGIQLKFITGSAEEGAKAFDIVTKAASKSAFSLEQMANASPLLLTVADNTDELNDLLAMTGDIAAATGLGFEETAGQIQRAMSGGIASADLFREKGVKSMLGFQEGVKYTAEESERMMKDAFKNATVSIAGAGEEMAGTFKGQMGMMNDAYFTFKKNVMEAGVFPALKEELGDLRVFLDDNQEAIDDIATALGEGIATSIMAVGEAVAFIAEHSETFKKAAKAMVVITLAKWFHAAAIGAFTLGKRLMFVNAMAGPIGWKNIVGGLAAMGVSLVVVNKLLGETEDGLDNTFKKTELEESLKEKVAQLDSLKNSMAQIEAHINSPEIMSLKDRYGVYADGDLGISGDRMQMAIAGDFDLLKETLEKEIAQLKEEIGALPPVVVAEDLVDKKIAKDLLDTGNNIDELAKSYKNLASAATTTFGPVNTNTDMITKMGKSVFSATEEMSKNFIPTITTSTEMLSHNARSAHEMIHATDIMTTTWASSTDMLSHNYVPAQKSVIEIMAEMHESTMKQINAEKEKKKALEESLKVEREKQKEIYRALKGRIDTTIKALKSERETEVDLHNQRLGDIRAFYTGSLHEQRQGQELARKEQLRHEKAMAKIKKSQVTDQFNIFKSGQFAQLDLSEMTNDQLVDFTAKAGMDVLSSMAQQNRKAFALQKALNISIAIMNTAKGVSNALGTVPFPFNLAVAGIIGAAGAVQIATIASQQYSGRRFGGPVSNDESYIVGENGPELFTPGATGRITANEGMVGGGQTINFNITATDAKSVDELIVQRKPMIVNMIRQATIERGNRPAF